MARLTCWPCPRWSIDAGELLPRLQPSPIRIQCKSGTTAMTFRHTLPALALAFFAGCQSMEFGGLRKASDKLAITSKDEKIKESEYETPARLIAIWSEAMYTQPGQRPTRGFGGRLYFYNVQDKTVPVEGQLVVYAYDDSQDGRPSQTPSRKFVFTPEQFTQHYSATQLGASYSIWIPWDQVGGVRKSISLMPVFTATNGQVVMGEQSVSVLPGKAPENPEPAPQGYFTPLSSQDPQGVRPASYAGESPGAASSRDSWQKVHTYEPNGNSQTQLRSTTIQLPMTMTQRLIQQRNAPPPSEPAAALNRNSPDATTASGTPGHDEYTMASGTASAPGSAPPAPPATRFVRPRSPAPRAPIVRPSPVRAATLPRRAEPQLDPPSPPAPNPGPSAEAAVPTDFAPAGWGR